MLGTTYTSARHAHNPAHNALRSEPHHTEQGLQNQCSTQLQFRKPNTQSTGNPLPPSVLLGSNPSSAIVYAYPGSILAVVRLPMATYTNQFGDLNCLLGARFGDLNYNVFLNTLCKCNQSLALGQYSTASTRLIA